MSRSAHPRSDIGTKFYVNFTVYLNHLSFTLDTFLCYLSTEIFKMEALCCCL